MGQSKGSTFTADAPAANVPIRTPMFDDGGNLTRTWLSFFQGLGTGTGGGEAGPPGPAGQDGAAGPAGASGLREGAATLLMTLSGVIQIDLAGGKHQHLVLDASMESGGVTIASFPPPIWTGETIQEGDTFILHVDQDLTGHHPFPILSTAAGGWAADCQIEIASGSAESTAIQFTFLGGVWRLITVRRSVATA